MENREKLRGLFFFILLLVLTILATGCEIVPEQEDNFTSGINPKIKTEDILYDEFGNPYVQVNPVDYEKLLDKMEFNGKNLTTSPVEWNYSVVDEKLYLNVSNHSINGKKFKIKDKKNMLVVEHDEVIFNITSSAEIQQVDNISKSKEWGHYSTGWENYTIESNFTLYVRAEDVCYQSNEKYTDCIRFPRVTIENTSLEGRIFNQVDNNTVVVYTYGDYDPILIRAPNRCFGNCSITDYTGRFYFSNSTQDQIHSVYWTGTGITNETTYDLVSSSGNTVRFVSVDYSTISNITLVSTHDTGGDQDVFIINTTSGDLIANKSGSTNTGTTSKSAIYSLILNGSIDGISISENGLSANKQFEYINMTNGTSLSDLTSISYNSIGNGNARLFSSTQINNSSFFVSFYSADDSIHGLVINKETYDLEQDHNFSEDVTTDQFMVHAITDDDSYAFLFTYDETPVYNITFYVINLTDGTSKGPYYVEETLNFVIQDAHACTIPTIDNAVALIGADQFSRHQPFIVYANGTTGSGNPANDQGTDDYAASGCFPDYTNNLVAFYYPDSGNTSRLVKYYAENNSWSHSNMVDGDSFELTSGTTKSILNKPFPSGDGAMLMAWEDSTYDLYIGAFYDASTTLIDTTYNTLVGTGLNSDQYTSFDFSFDVRTIPNVQNVILNSSSLGNTTDENLTVYFDTNNSYNYVADWQESNVSLALLNMPFSLNDVDLPKDYSTYGFNGVSYNSPIWKNERNGSMKFDGVDDYIEIGDVTDFVLNESFTVSLFTQWDGVQTGTKDLIGKHANPGAHQGWVMELNIGTGISLVLGTTAGWKTATGPMLNTSQYYHIVISYNDATDYGYIYVDGVERANVSAPDRRANVINQLHIGNSDNYGNRYNGTIDDVLIFNYTLSPEQIIQLYNQGLNNQSFTTLVSQETTDGDIYTVNVTATTYWDEVSVVSNSLTIGNATPPADSCTYSSGNHTYECADTCTLVADVNVDAGSTITVNGSGTFTGLRYIKGADTIRLQSGCRVIA